MKSPLRIGVVAAPKRQFPIKPSRPQPGKASRIASLSAAAAMVVGVGATSAIFVDYLADRALARAAESPAPVVVKRVVAAQANASKVVAKAEALAPDVTAEAAAPVRPAETQIAAVTPNAEAIAKVAIGPEHAIELPADDPTASPILQFGEESEDVSSIDDTVSSEEPIAADAEEADGTQTAAIDPAEAVLDGQPTRKPKRQKAQKAKPAVEQDTEVASLPGVNVGGMAGHPSGDGENSASTVRTVTKPGKTAAKNLGGVAAGPARVTAAVKLRTGPSKGNGVAGVVPAGSAVNVLSCDGWCQVSYNGRTGWVYKNFLTGSKAQKKAAASKPQKQPAAKSASAAQPAAPVERKAMSSRLSDG